MQYYQYEKVYETSPRSKTIDEINDSYQRQDHSQQQFTYKSSVAMKVIKNEKNNREYEQYTEDYKLKIQNIKKNLLLVEEDLKKEIEKLKIKNKEREEEDILKSISNQMKEVEQLQPIIDKNNEMSMEQLLKNIKKDCSDQFIEKLNNVGKNDKEGYFGMIGGQEEKITIELLPNLEGVQPVQKNLSHFQQLEKKVALIEKVLGINISNQYDIKLNLKLERNIHDLEELNLNSEDYIKRIKILKDDMENLQIKKEDVGFKDDKFQMIQDTWGHYELYREIEDQIQPARDRIKMLKNIYEESDKIYFTIESLQKIEKDLKEGLFTLEEDILTKKNSFSQQIVEINTKLKKLETAMRL